jgi:hypothetical protein
MKREIEIEGGPGKARKYWNEKRKKKNEMK